MTINLEKLLFKFKNINDFEYDDTMFKTNVKSVAPKAYLNIIYPPANARIQSAIIEPLGLPKELRNFYWHYNGAHLFVTTLRIYGFDLRNQPIDRSDWRKSKPNDFMDINEKYFNDVETSKILCVGSYGYDNSEVYLDKSSEKVHCCERSDFDKIRTSWDSFNEWVGTEIVRLSKYHDDSGNCLVKVEETLP